MTDYSRERIFDLFNEHFDMIHSEKDKLIDDLIADLSANKDACYALKQYIIDDFIATYEPVVREYEKMNEIYKGLKSWVNSEDREACEQELRYRAVAESEAV